jgi:hypothetical protein
MASMGVVLKINSRSLEMTLKPTQSASQKKKKAGKVNKGGRPKKGTPGSSATQWKVIHSPPGGTNQYEVNAQGQVRRKLKNGEYRDVKPWVTGGPYACVYLYGYPNATRHRKKVYVHRLVAMHFLTGKQGRKKNEVVHHKVGPANNTASQLEWVSIEENAKARKYFNPDGTRKNRKVSKSVPKPNALKKKVSTPQAQPVPTSAQKKKVAIQAKPKKTDLQPAKIPPKYKKADHKPVKLAKMEKLPDADVFIPKTETLEGKVKYLAKVSVEFKQAFMRCKAAHPKLKLKNFAEYFRRATGKGLKLGKAGGPQKWKTKLISALEAIRTRLKS